MYLYFSSFEQPFSQATQIQIQITASFPVFIFFSIPILQLATKSNQFYLYSSSSTLVTWIITPLTNFSFLSDHKPLPNHIPTAPIWCFFIVQNPHDLRTKSKLGIQSFFHNLDHSYLLLISSLISILAFLLPQPGASFLPLFLGGNLTHVCKTSFQWKTS